MRDKTLRLSEYVPDYLAIHAPLFLIGLSIQRIEFTEMIVGRQTAKEVHVGDLVLDGCQIDVIKMKEHNGGLVVTGPGKGTRIPRGQTVNIYMMPKV